MNNAPAIFGIVVLVTFILFVAAYGFVKGLHNREKRKDAERLCDKFGRKRYFGGDK